MNIAPRTRPLLIAPLSLISLISLITLLALGALAPTAHAQDPRDPAELPLLEPGLHLGTTFYGSGEVPDDAALRDVVADAAGQGMDGFAFSVDWFSLEPTPGEYRLDDLRASLDWLHGLGIQPLLNISFIDISDLTLPADLVNDDGTGLAGGMAFDDPVMVARLTGLLDQVVPLLAENGGFLLLLGNEVDGWFNDYGTDPAILEAYTRLIAAARDHVHTMQPELAVGVTLTGTEVLAQGPVFQALRPVADVIPFNFYPVDWWSVDWFTVLDLAEIPPFIDDYMRIYGDDPVVIQELGCPSAEANGSSPDYQAQCFEVLFEALAPYPNVRYVSVFTLFDWSEPACDLVVEWFGLTEEELPGVYFERWRGYLCTLGLLNPDYTPKPAWDVFLGVLNDR